MQHWEKLPILYEMFLENIKMKKIKIVLLASGLFLLACKSSLQLSSVKPSQLKIDSALVEDEQIKNFYAPYKRSLDSQMNAVLNVSEIELQKSQPESPLSNFFADAVASTCRAKGIDFDFGLPSTNGGIRTSLPKGEITRRHLFELMPFENEVVVLTLKAESVQKLLEYIVEKGGQPLTGIQIYVAKNGSIKASINGQELKSTGVYKVLTSDYLANGGDGIDAFKEAVKRESTNIKVRDAIIDYVIAEKKMDRTLNPKKDGRIIIEQ